MLRSTRNVTTRSRLTTTAIIATAVFAGGCGLLTSAIVVASSHKVPEAGSALAATTAAAAAPIVSDTRIAAARRYARLRGADVSFAVIESPGGIPRGLNPAVGYPSASVTKAMLMVAVLRSAHQRSLSSRERALLRPMITKSDNDAATIVFHSVGERGLTSVARHARMMHFDAHGFWASANITAADQARFFFRMDTIVPPRHVDYARTLLSEIVPSQRWGIARIADQRGYMVFFKGGWRNAINHQVALLEKDGRRFSLAVMTRQTGARGRRTEEGIARKLL